MKKILSLLLMAALYTATLSAQTSYEPVIDNIVRSYMPWQSATFSGKLKSDKLPITPTVKIYMERDSLLQLSLRAPLIGEVGRLDINPRQITIVNKLKRVYCQEPTEKLLDVYPGIISDIQSLLLARVVILGQGELQTSHSDIIEVEEDREGGWLLIPSTKDALLNYNYGYLIGNAGRTRALIATVPGKFSLELTYTYNNGGMQMGIDFDSKGKRTHADLDFSSVKWGGNAMQPMKLINYNRVSIKEFIKSVK